MQPAKAKLKGIETIIKRRISTTFTLSGTITATLVQKTTVSTSSLSFPNAYLPLQVHTSISPAIHRDAGTRSIPAFDTSIDALHEVAQ
jgi:hypothetical protein